MQRINKGVSGNILRSQLPLTDDQIRAVCPSIFAEEPWSGCSKRYTFLPTIEVLQGLRAEGFEPFMVAQSRTKDEEKQNFTRHMIRFRHATQIADSVANEVILMNAHDKTSRGKLTAGCFRFVCANGMVTGDIVQEVNIMHSGNVKDDYIEGAFTLLKEFDKVDESREAMQAITLQDSERLLLASSAMALKYDEPDKAPIRADQLLDLHRYDDRKSDLFTTFNVIQENLIRGGLQGRTANNRRTRTRPVNGLTDNMKLNKALWNLAEGMRQLKEGDLKLDNLFADLAA